MYTPWLREGALYKSVRPYMEDLNWCICHLILEWSGEGPLFKLELKKWRDQYVGTIRVIPWAIIYVKAGTLGQVSHQCKSLFYVV